MSVTGSITVQQTSAQTVCLNDIPVLKFITTTSDINLTTDEYQGRFFVIIENTSESDVTITYNINLTSFLGENEVYEVAGGAFDPDDDVWDVVSLNYVTHDLYTITT